MFPNKNIIVLTVLISFLVFFTQGCFKPRPYRLAQELNQKGLYAEAFSYYQSALASEKSPPKRTRIESELNALRTVLVNQVLQQAQQERDKQKPATLDSLQKAIDILFAGLPYDDPQSQIKNKLIVYQKERQALAFKHKDSYNQAEALYISGQLSESLAMFEQILKQHPDNNKIKRRIQDIQDEIDDKKNRYTQNIYRYMQEGSPDIANYFIEKLEQLEPRNPEIAQLKSQVSQTRKTQEPARPKATEPNAPLDQTQTERTNLLSANPLFTMDPPKKGEPQANQPKDANDFYERAIKNLIDNRPYHAYADSIKAKKLNPNDLGIAKAYEECESYLEESFYHVVTLIPFQSTPNSTEQGKLFTKALSADLETLLPQLVKLIVRSDSGKNTDENVKVDEGSLAITGYVDGFDKNGLNPQQVTVKIVDLHEGFINDEKELKPDAQKSASKATAEYIVMKYNELPTYYYQQAQSNTRKDNLKAMEYLAKGVFFCHRVNGANQDCKKLEDLFLSVSQ